MHTFHWEQNSVLQTEMVFDEAEGRKSLETLEYSSL